MRYSPWTFPLPLLSCRFREPCPDKGEPRRMTFNRILRRMVWAKMRLLLLKDEDIMYHQPGQSYLIDRSKTFKRYSLLQPALRRLALIPILALFSWRRRLSAKWRRTAKLWSARPVRIRDSSSRNAMSSTQCTLFW
jgi:hypothetical protein